MALARDILKFSKLSNVFDFANLSNAGSLKNACTSFSVRTAKHYDPKFKWLRGKKFIDIILPHTEKYKKRQKDFLRNCGIFPRHWKPRPLTVTSAHDILDPYVPEVGDGKVTLLSKGIQNLASASKSKILDTTALRKVKNYDVNFKKDLFVQEAQDIYVNAHTVLMEHLQKQAHVEVKLLIIFSNDPEALSKYVTERALGEMVDGVKGKTLRWKFLESLEPPVIVRARVQEVVTKTNLFAQLTVRFHTKQTLAIYDRFGRLMYGSEIIPKDVLEYVIFEKHINNEYGEWKLHGKIIPEWREPTTQYSRTYRIEEVVDDDDDEILFDEQDPEPDPDLRTDAATSEIVQSEAKPQS